jgi:hypothetical protein
MPSFDAFNPEIDLSQQLSPIELAGATPTALSKLAVPEAHALVMAILKARIRMSHPDLGGDAEQARVLSDLRTELQDPDVFREQFRDLCTEFSPFEKRLNELLGTSPKKSVFLEPSTDEHVLLDLHGVRHRFAHSLRLPAASGVAWPFLHSAELSYLDFAQFYAYHQEYLSGRGTATTQASDNPFTANRQDLSETQIDREIEKLVVLSLENLTGDSFFSYALRAKEAFWEQLLAQQPDLHERYFREPSTSGKLDPFDEAKLLDEVDGFWRQFVDHDRPAISSKERKEYEREVRETFRSGLRESVNRSETAQELRRAKREKREFPKTFFDRAEERFIRTASIDQNGTVYGADFAREDGLKIVGSIPSSITNFQVFSLKGYGADDDGKFQSIGKLSEVGKLLNSNLIHSDSRSSFERRQTTEGAEELRFNWHTSADMLVLIDQPKKGLYSLRCLGPLVSITYNR